MNGKKLWSPTTTAKNIDRFINFLKNKEEFVNYEDLHKWSIEKKEIFWDKFWEFTNIIGEKKEKIFTDSKHFINTKFFESSTLNYAENCLQNNNDQDALIFYNEQKNIRRVSYKQLKINVFKISYYFKSKKNSKKR